MKVVVLFGLLGAVLGGMSLDDIRSGFKRLDMNNDGTVRTNEVTEFFNRIDTNGDGFATLEEFKAYLPADVPQAKLQGSFKFYDKTDGEDDNKVSREVASKVFDNLDLNDDREIPFEEFMQTYPLMKAAIAKEILALSA
ncbi:hypothetical protein C0Q70_17528 [Pomacea canaliculata]|uniref:EF-hand domain-containing protein n=1 Tax=Pomacea canaliculata TaxID=400727 RepID=A0A2T7NKN4_POMCA|nr:uncharacterized protein LOC112575460 [Pomacea canaliculata]PVD21728.1 hypothetical protein C0Q70_17528 [Pomacea canaliculata]